MLFWIVPTPGRVADHTAGGCPAARSSKSRRRTKNTPQNHVSGDRARDRVPAYSPDDRLPVFDVPMAPDRDASGEPGLPPAWIAGPALLVRWATSTRRPAGVALPSSSARLAFLSAKGANDAARPTARHCRGGRSTRPGGDPGASPETGPSSGRIQDDYHRPVAGRAPVAARGSLLRRFRWARPVPAGGRARRRLQSASRPKRIPLVRERQADQGPGGAHHYLDILLNLLVVGQGAAAPHPHDYWAGNSPRTVMTDVPRASSSFRRAYSTCPWQCIYYSAMFNLPTLPDPPLDYSSSARHQRRRCQGHVTASLSRSPSWCSRRSTPPLAA